MNWWHPCCNLWSGILCQVSFDRRPHADWCHYKQIVGWGFCDIQNNGGSVYQPKAKAEADNPYREMIILDITKSESNNVFIIHWTEKKLYYSHVFASSLTASSTKQANLTWLPLENMHCGHTCPYYAWPWVSLTWLLYNLQLWCHRRWFRECTVRFRPIRKEIASWMYNNYICRVFVA